nr:MAG TPA: hypothetical protein [Caudoviricetes sp.]
MSFCFVHIIFTLFSHIQSAAYHCRQANQRRCNRRRFLFGDRRDSGPTSCQRQPSYVGRIPTAKDVSLWADLDLRLIN